MYHFVLQIVIMASLGTLVYLAARKIPQISDVLPEDTTGRPAGVWHRIELMLGRLPLDRFDLIVSQFLEKNVRKMKLFLARIDNHLNQHLERFKMVKQRTHRKQQKKFALFESNELSEGRGEQNMQDATIFKMESRQAEDAGVEKK